MILNQKLIKSLIYGVNIFFLHINYVLAEKNTTSEVIIVQGEDPNGAIDGYVAKQSSTINKTGVSILKTPQSVSVIGRKELTDRNAQTITDAIQYSPGIYALSSPTSQRYDNFLIRGLDATLNGILLDGLRSNTNQLFIKYQPYGMERIEVLRGPSGFLFGGGALSGAVNAISKRPTKKKLHEVGFQFGNFNHFQGQLDFSGPINHDKSLRFRLVGVARKSDSQLKYVPNDTIYLAPSLSWKPNSNTELTLLTTLNYDKFGPPRPFLPVYGTILPNPNGKIPRYTYLDAKHLDNHLYQFGIGYIFDHRFDKTWSLHSVSRYNYTHLNTQTFAPYILKNDMQTLYRTAYEYKLTGNVFSTDNYAKAQWEMKDVKGVSVLGLSWRNMNEDYLLNLGMAPTINIFHPIYNTSFNTSIKGAKSFQNANEVGIYTGHSLTFFKHVVLDVALRQDWVVTDTHDKLYQDRVSQNDHTFTYRTGLSYVTDWGIAPYFSYTTSFTPMIGTNLYGEAFKPTTGNQIETGIKYQPKTFDGLFTFAWFDLSQDNVQTTDPNNILNSIQTGQVNSKGIELSATANITPSLKLLANYTYNLVRITKTTNAQSLGKVPTGTPQQMASIWADYRFLQGSLAGLGISGGMHYVGAIYADPSNKIKAPGFALFDAAIHYQFNKEHPNTGLGLDINLNNIFNKRYYLSCAAMACNEGLSRTVIGTLKYHW